MLKDSVGCVLCETRGKHVLESITVWFPKGLIVYQDDVPQVIRMWHLQKKTSMTTWRKTNEKPKHWELYEFVWSQAKKHRSSITPFGPGIPLWPRPGAWGRIYGMDPQQPSDATWLSGWWRWKVTREVRKMCFWLQPHGQTCLFHLLLVVSTSAKPNSELR